MESKNFFRAVCAFVAILSLWLLGACGEGEETPKPVNPGPSAPPPPGGPGVYVGGTALNGSTAAATYWKNGEATYLTASHPKGIINTTGYDIAVHGDERIRGRPDVNHGW